MNYPGQTPQTSGGGSGQSQPQGGERLQYGGSPEQVMSNGIQLPFLEAFVDQTGDTVTLLAACNWTGHSPANIGVDSRGKQFVASFDEVTIADARAVPNLQLLDIRQRQTQIRQRTGYATQGQLTTR